MTPFGGTPRCPRCEKAVYAAEQTMGPGRKMYHKSCLTCADCNKRLDSVSLLEHEGEVYCKNCHRKNFGTRDLRQANLPHRPDLGPLAPSFTGNGGSTLLVRTNSTRAPYTSTLEGRAVAPSLLRPTRPFSPARLMTLGATVGRAKEVVQEEEKLDIKDDDGSEEDEVLHSPRAFPPGMPTHTGRSESGLPRTVPLTPTHSGTEPTKPIPAFDDDESDTPADTADSPPTAPPELPARPQFSPATIGVRQAGVSPSPLSSGTGTRNGAGITPLRATPTGNRWAGRGSTTPVCPRCNKSVYFAEQVKAVGRTWHKACLRCTECKTTLDATRLTEREGAPYCHRCYNKLHGPAGNGYALLGKAGG